jgi:hypothetical protein
MNDVHECGTRQSQIDLAGAVGVAELCGDWRDREEGRKALRARATPSCFCFALLAGPRTGGLRLRSAGGDRGTCYLSCQQQWSGTISNSWEQCWGPSC